MPGQGSLALWDQLTHMSENPTQNDTHKIALESGVQMPSAPGAQSSEDDFAFNTWTAVMDQPPHWDPWVGEHPHGGSVTRDVHKMSRFHLKSEGEDI